MKTSRLLVLTFIVGVIACRSTGTPVTPEPDAGGIDTAQIDTPVTPVDNPVTPMDTPVGTDLRPPRDIGPCDRTGPENTAVACADGLDNDCNGYSDCVDFACASFCRDGSAPTDRAAMLDTAGCVRMGSEGSAASCADGIDNDCDGWADCNDRNCSCVGACGPSSFGARGCVCDGHAAEGSTAGQCTDARDNDCNGYTDSMDFGCTPRDGGAPDVTRDVVARLDTNGCVSSGTETTAATCGDGIDNDCNGYADCNDFACSCVGSCGPSTRAPTCVCMGAEASDGTCGDHIDNDCDGYTDCTDFSCSMTPAVTICPSDGGAHRG